MPLVLNRRLQPLRGLVDLAPVVTVILLLLCFFLLSSSFVLQPGIKVDLPHNIKGMEMPSSGLIVAVTLSPLQFDDAGKPLPRTPVLYFNDQIVTIAGLHDALDKLPSSRVTPSLVLKADKDVSIDLINQIIDAEHDSRFPVVIATQPATANAVP